MALYRKEGSPFIWVDVRLNGVRHRVSTKQTKMGIARQFETDLIHKLSTGLLCGSVSKPPTLAEFAVRFLDFVRDARIDADTKRYYENGWRMLSALSIANMRVRDISTSYASSLTLPGSGGNVNCGLRTLRRMLSLAEEWGVIVRAPKVRLVKEIKRERLIYPEEEALLLRRANPTLRDVLTLMMDTGMRPSEVVCLRWEQIDLVERTVLVAGGKTHNARRLLPIGSTRAWEMLVRRSSNGSPWVFPSNRSKSHLKVGSITVMFSALKRELGLPKDLVLYSARHTFATDMQAAVCDLSQTSRHLGHGSLAITQRYLHPEISKSALMMDARNAAREKAQSGHTASEPDFGPVAQLQQMTYDA